MVRQFAVALMVRHGDNLLLHNAWKLAAEMADAEPKGNKTERLEGEPEATPEPGGDYQLGLYANAVVELDACVEMWFIEDDYRRGFTPEQTIERWRNHVSYSKDELADAEPKIG